MQDKRFYKIIRKLIRPITNILWPVKIIGKNKFVEGKGIYICNHYTLLDPVPFVTELFENNFNALMKEEAVHMPLLGRILLKIGTIPVKREEADFHAVKKCLQVLKNDEPLIVFPEGTRNKSGSREMLEFKDGVAMFAIKTKSPVIPMIYDAPIKTFRRRYLMIGEPILLDEFYEENPKEARVKATRYIRHSMEELQESLEQLKGDKKQLKLLLKSQKAEIKMHKKQIKLERKQVAMLDKPKDKAKED